MIWRHFCFEGHCFYEKTWRHKAEALWSSEDRVIRVQAEDSWWQWQDMKEAENKQDWRQPRSKRQHFKRPFAVEHFSIHELNSSPSIPRPPPLSSFYRFRVKWHSDMKTHIQRACKEDVRVWRFWKKSEMWEGKLIKFIVTSVMLGQPLAVRPLASEASWQASPRHWPWKRIHTSRIFSNTAHLVFIFLLSSWKRMSLRY